MSTLLRSVSLIAPIFFDGQSVKQIVSNYGAKLVLDGNFVIATPAKAGKAVKHIPLTNVSDLEPIDEKLEAAKAKEAKETEIIRAAASKARSNTKALPGASSKFVKNDQGEIVEILS